MQLLQHIIIGLLISGLTLAAPAGSSGINRSESDGIIDVLARIETERKTSSRGDKQASSASAEDPVPSQTAAPDVTSGPGATVEPAPTATPEPVIAAEIVTAPETLLCKSVPDPSAFSLSVTYAGGSTEIVTPETVTADTSGTGFRSVYATYRGFTAEKSIQVIPRQVANVRMTGGTATSQNVAWDALEEAARYEIQTASAADGSWQTLATATEPSFEFTGLTQGVLLYVRIRAISEDMNSVANFGEIQVTGEGAWSTERAIAARPNDMGTVTPTAAARKKVTLTWDAVTGATGYAVYYRLTSEDDSTYEEGATSTGTTCTVKNLSGGYDYTFKVIPYAADEVNAGAYSEVDCGTAPSLPTLTVRGGDDTIRVNWTGGRAAVDFKLYMSEDEDGDYSLIETFLTPIDFKVYSIHELQNDKKYYIKMVAEREVPGGLHAECETSAFGVKTKPADPTSTKPKLYKTKKKFMKSPACVNYPDFKKALNYNKSFAIPGMINTNAGGFNAGYMVPQDMAVVKDHILMTAYDHSGINDSVIYVMNKSNRSLETVILLPHKGHLGGIAFDGSNLWLAYGTKLHLLPWSTVEESANSGAPYVELYHFSGTIETGETISYITYYMGFILAGAYNELEPQYVYVYRIDGKNSNPTLTKAGKALLPNRTQGITFSGGAMMLSRSCQTNKNQRGFMSQLEIYKPKISTSGTMKLGDCVKTILLPPMNEGIVTVGAFTYITFESSVFSGCEAPVDRCIAFKTKKLLKIKKK